MKKFLNQYSNKLLESDLSGEIYDEPVYGGGYLTKHARERCKERHVDESDAILNKPSANTIERGGFIVTVLGALDINNKPTLSTMRCFYCNKLGHMKKKCPILKQKKFNNKIIKNNRKRYHNNEKIKCDKCDKIINRNYFNNHKCDVGFNCKCGKIFRSNTDLMNHKRDKPNCTSKAIKKINIHEQPIDKCVHSWEWLNERIHNKGDGKGKYKAYKCQKCKAFQRRYI